MTSNSSTSKTSTRRKRKGVTTDSTMGQISKNFHSFIEMVRLEFKTFAKTATRNAGSATKRAESSVCNTKIVALRKATRIEIEEKKKLLSQIHFTIDKLNDDEALIMLQALAEDEDQLKVLWNPPNDKKLCFCCIFLAKMPYHPSGV